MARRRPASRHRRRPPSSPTADTVVATDAAIADAAAEPACGTTRQLAPGLTWQTAPIARTPPVDLGDRCLYLLRIDPKRHELRILTAFTHGKARSAPNWAAEFDLVAAINTSMYRPNNRSTGMLIHGDEVNNDRDTRKFGAFLAFDPVAADDPPVAMFGRGCPGFDLKAIRARYRGVVQNYRILDCQGKAIAWKDPKIYSAAAVAIDAQGQLVFIHVRTPYLMRDLADMLAAPELGLRAAMFVEGGHEATLYVNAGGFERTLVGSYESATREHNDDSSRRAGHRARRLATAQRHRRGRADTGRTMNELASAQRAI